MIASYLRESTDRQDITTQRTLIREHAEQKKISVQEFADDDTSSRIPFAKRTQGRRLLELVKQGKVEELICYRVDRLGRDHLDTGSAIREFHRRGVRVLSLKEGYQENTNTGRLTTSILTAVAENERESIVQRSKDAILTKANEREFWMGGVAPYGYRLNGQRREMRKKSDTRLELFDDPIPGCESWSQVKVVQRIFRMAAEGRSCYEIAADLTRLGIPPAGSLSDHWRPSLIRNLIISTTYKGIHAWGKTKRTYDDDGGKKVMPVPRDKWTTGPCPAIVNEEIWSAANAALPKNQIVAMAHAQNNYLLRGLIRCGVCGLTFSGAANKRPGGGKNYYYRCAASQRRYVRFGSSKAPRCTSCGVRGEGLEAAVWADIEGFLSKPGAVIRQLEEQMIAEGGEGRRVADEISDLENALARNVASRSNLVSLLTDGVITREDFKQQECRLAEKNAGIEQQLAKLRQLSAHAESRTVALGVARSYLETLKEMTRGGLSFEQRRQAASALVDRVTVTAVAGQKPQVVVRYRFDPDARRTTQNWKENASLAPNYAHLRTTPEWQHPQESGEAPADAGGAATQFRARPRPRDDDRQSQRNQGLTVSSANPPERKWLCFFD